MALSSLFGQLIKLKTGAVLFDPPPCEYVIPEPMWDRVNRLGFDHRRCGWPRSLSPEYRDTVFSDGAAIFERQRGYRSGHPDSLRLDHDLD